MALWSKCQYLLESEDIAPVTAPSSPASWLRRPSPTTRTTTDQEQRKAVVLASSKRIDRDFYTYLVNEVYADIGRALAMNAQKLHDRIVSETNVRFDRMFHTLNSLLKE